MTATTNARAVYLDASAAVKLIVAEPETAALQSFLQAWPRRVASEVIRVELVTFADRNGVARADAERICSGLQLIPLRSDSIDDALSCFEPPQRAFDALHLGTALRARSVLAWFVSYDERQLPAARTAGLPTVSPGCSTPRL